MRAACLVLCLAAIAGCDDTSAPERGTIADAGTYDASPIVDASSDANVPDGDAESSSGYGYVFVTTFEQGPAVSTSLSAAFWLDPFFAKCGIQVVGACTISPCTHFPMGAATASAGEITVSGGLFALDASPDPTSAGGSYDDDENMVLFHGGESLTVAASGAVVPAFSIELAAPSPIQITAPSASSDVASGQDLAFSWSGGGGDVLVAIGSSVSCVFPAANGSGIVPAKVLDMLPRGATSLVVTGKSSAQVTSGVFAIDVAVFDARPRLKGTITLQSP